MKISEMTRNVEAIDGGIWVADIPGADGIKLKVRGTTSEAFADCLAHKQRSAKKADKNADGSMTLAAGRRQFREALHEAALLDWEGFEDEGGKPVKYSAKKAEELVMDRRFKLADWVTTAAQRVDESTADQIEDISGN